MSSIKKSLIALATFAAIAVGLCYFVLYQPLNILPSIKVSLRVNDPLAHPLVCRWTVENNSDAIITFNAGDIRLVEIDGKIIETPTGAQKVVLLPKQEWKENIVIKKISSGYHTITVSANCVEGSSASMSTTVKIP